jgi:lipoprotein-releasing system permease protein
MMVTDKQSDIAILKTLGLSSGSIMNIFIVQGTLIGLIGTLFGVIFGVLLALNVENLIAWLEQLIGYQFLPADVYYISSLPSELNWNDVWVIAVTAFVLSILSTLYPSWRAAQVKPAEALRYE